MITFEVGRLKGEVKKLRKETNKADFWEDNRRAKKIMALLSRKEAELARIEGLAEKLESLKELNQLGVSEEDSSLEEDIRGGIDSLKREIRDLETSTLLTGEFDDSDALVSIHPGAGGLESQDWAEMLLRMYLRWAENKGFKVDLNDVQPGDGGGIKSAILTVHGEKAYGLLYCEKGVHRLVRISPFDYSKRRHTSFASLDVIPLIEDELEVEIDTKDLRIDTYRSSGAGGQHVNVTDSAVRITHIPTGIVVQCQNERSQISNRNIAMKILSSRILERKRREKEEELKALSVEKKEIAWGSQIRSYIFNPYQKVKDHRTGVETGNVQSVMDGDLDAFVEEALRWKKAQG